MNLTDPKVLKQLLDRHHISPQKRFGQHYLCSTNVVTKIVEAASGASGILEVGPGPGVLTSVLSTICDQLIAIEIDPRSVAMLAETAPKAKIVLGDVLGFNLEETLMILPCPRVVVSNMPYQITGPLLGKFAEVRGCYSKAVLMMQKEVGDKIRAQLGKKEFGSLSVFLQSQFEIRKLTSVPASAFFPPPKVESIVLELTPKSTGLPPELEPLFFKFVRTGFATPRKTLANNLMYGFKKDRVELEDLLKQASLEIMIRPHQVSLKDWYHLFELYESSSSRT